MACRIWEIRTVPSGGCSGTLISMFATGSSLYRYLIFDRDRKFASCCVNRPPPPDSFDRSLILDATITALLASLIGVPFQR